VLSESQIYFHRSSVRQTTPFWIITAIQSASHDGNQTTSLMTSRSSSIGYKQFIFLSRIPDFNFQCWISLSLHACWPSVRANVLKLHSRECNFFPQQFVWEQTLQSISEFDLVSRQHQPMTFFVCLCLSNSRLTGCELLYNLFNFQRAEASSEEETVLRRLHRPSTDSSPPAYAND